MSCCPAPPSIFVNAGKDASEEASSDILDRLGKNVWSIDKMRETVPPDVVGRFIAALTSGDPTAKSDRRAIEIGFQAW